MPNEIRLSSELVDASQGSGDATCKKEETHRVAEANRAFCTFSLIHEQDLYGHIDPWVIARRGQGE